jgi:hypothetical protein
MNKIRILVLILLLNAASILAVLPVPSSGNPRIGFAQHYQKVMLKPLPPRNMLTKSDVIKTLRHSNLAKEASEFPDFKHFIPYAIPELIKSDPEGSLSQILSPDSNLVSFMPGTNNSPKNSLSIDDLHKTINILLQTIQSDPNMKFDRKAVLALYNYIFIANVKTITKGSRGTWDQRFASSPEVYRDILTNAARFLVLQNEFSEQVVTLLSVSDVHFNINTALILKDATTVFQLLIIRALFKGM